MRSILVIKLGALGDLFLAMDAFQSLRAHHAGERLCLLTRPAFAKFAADLPWFDEVITDLTPRGLRLDRWWAMRKCLLSDNFARIYDLQCNRRTGLYHWLLGPGRRPEWVGIARGCSHPWPDYRRANLPVPERQLRMLASAGVPRLERAADLAWLDAPLGDLPVPSKPFVLLVPGCAPHRLEKRWPAERYAEFSRLLARERGLASVVIGTAADESAVRAICAAAPEVVNLCGRTSLKQLGALARRAQAVVGNDTGPVHITAAVGAPTLVVMSGHSDPVRMRPRGPRVEIVQETELANLTAGRVLSALILRGDHTAALMNIE